MRATQFNPLIVSIALLAGCSSSAPGPADVKAAMRNSATVMAGLEASLELERRLTGQIMSAEDLIARSTIDVRGCVSAAGSDGFVCEFRVTRPAAEDCGSEAECAAPAQAVVGAWSKTRFFRTGSSWQMDTPTS